jgi:sugar/nucleoside kinase (ribokinase family)
LIRIWYRKNGLDAPRSSTEVTIRTSAEPEVAAWNFVDTFAAGDTFQLVCFFHGHEKFDCCRLGNVVARFAQCSLYYFDGNPDWVAMKHADVKLVSFLDEGK